MLQFSTYESSPYTIEEQVKIALDGGCKWIRLSGTPHEDTIRNVIPSCRDAEAILTLDDNVTLVDELRIHGLHLTSWDRGSVIAAREKLGPHAILGVTCNSPENVHDLSGLDVDYMTIPYPSGDSPVDFYKSFMGIVKGEKVDIHTVASGIFPLAQLKPILGTGVEGFELSKEILDAPDPSSFIHLVMNSIK